MNSESRSEGSASAAWVVAQTGIGVCIGIAMFLAFRSARSVQVDERETIDALAPLRLLDRLRLVAESASMTTAESGLRWPGGDGESAQYDLNAFGRLKEVTFSIRANRNGDRWLVRSPAGEILGVEAEHWQLIDGNRTHAGSQQNRKRGGESYRYSAFFWIGGFIPISSEIVSPKLTLEIENLAEERISVDAGKILATRHRIYRSQKDKGRIPFLEVWTSHEVQPLGIVMARWRGEWLRLCQQNSQVVAEGGQIREKDHYPDADTLVAMVSNPQFTRKCSSCHFVDIGGEDVTLDDTNVVSGKSLKFPDVLYHWRAAGMKFKGRAAAGVVDEGKTQVLPDSVRIERFPTREAVMAGARPGKAEVLPKESTGDGALAAVDLEQNGTPFVLTSNLGRGRVFVRLLPEEHSKESLRGDLEGGRIDEEGMATSSAKGDDSYND